MKKLTDLVKQAKEAVKDLGEPLKTEAFKIILSKSIDGNFTVKTEEKTKISQHKSQKIGKGSEVEEICSKINRTEFPKMYNLKKALEQALYLLKIVRDTLSIEGLLPLQISKILASVFKIKTTTAAINMALGSAGTYVDRKPVRVQGGQGYKYLLMHDGEEYLKSKLENGEDK